MKNSHPNPRPRARHQTIGLFVGLTAAVVLLVLPPPEGLSEAGWRTAALGILMGIWWATEALPAAVTALLPLAAFPVLGISDIKTVSAPYSHPTIYLFLGGFMVALAVQRWNLHERIALNIVAAFGGTGASIIGGFMLASALISMWMTNTSTTMMLLPIATSVVLVVQQNLPESRDARERFPVAMLLGVAYGATIGGVATLIGTPPNAFMAGFLMDNYGIAVDFAEWMLVGVPLTACLLPLSWWLLTHRLYPVRFSTSGEVREHLRELLRALGPMTVPEKRVAIVFFCLAGAWMSRPLLSRLAPGLSDTGLAMMAAIALFFIPSGAQESPVLMRWQDTRDLPWGLLLLFGGGLSLAATVSNTGLAEWLGKAVVGLNLGHQAILVIVVATTIIFLTELTSNLATTATFLPVFAAVAAEAGQAPITLAAPVALAASCAFMLPVATPPNAVVYGSGLLTIPQMVRAGFWLNIVSIFLVSLVALTLAPAVLG